MTLQLLSKHVHMCAWSQAPQSKRVFCTDVFFFTEEKGYFLFFPFITIEKIEFVFNSSPGWFMSCASVPPTSSLCNFPAEARGWLAAQEGENLWKCSGERSFGYFDLSSILWTRTESSCLSHKEDFKGTATSFVPFEPGPEEWSGKCFSVFSDLLLSCSWSKDPDCHYKLTAQDFSFISKYIPGGDHNSHIGRYMTYIAPINGHSCPLLSEFFVSPFYFPQGAEGPYLSLGLITRTKAPFQWPISIPDTVSEKSPPSISDLKWPYIQMQP